MNFSDVFKSSFLESITEFSAIDTLIAMIFALVIGMFIYLIYKKTFTGIMYSTGFGMSLIGLSLVTTLVGALSIVRFRAAIKEPMEIVFLFWSLASGIVIGAGMIPLAVIGSVIIGLIMVLFVNCKFSNTPYILIINCNNEQAEEEVTRVIRSGVKRFIVKSKTVNSDGIELTAEIRVKDAATSFVNRVNEVTGVSGATLVTYNGEYMS